MIVEPYKSRPAPPKIGVLTDGGGYLDEHGHVHKPDRHPDGLQVWASDERVQALLKQGKGRAVCWQGRPIRYAPHGDGYHVRVVGVPFPELDDDAVAGVARWRDWLAAEGAAPLGSLGSTSMGLLKASIRRPLRTSEPFKQCPPVRFTIGGRQELGPRGAPTEYAGDLRHFDLRAAYARLLGGLEYGGAWYRIHGAKLDEHADLLDRAGRMVFVRARVALSGVEPGPLVRRPRREPETVFGTFPEYPVRGEIQGLWTMPEVRSAAEHGARVRLIEGWFHANGSDDPYPFGLWLERVERGRLMRGLAGMLAKATGNALWGQFCIRPAGRRQVLFYHARGGRRVLIDLPARGGRRPAHDLSEYLTGHVRASLFRFMAAAGDRLCCAHTDGGWVDVTGGGWRYPDWRRKEVASRLRVLDPQVLAYTDSGGVERYVVSGWPSDTAGDRFESEWAERARVAA